MEISVFFTNGQIGTQTDNQMERQNGTQTDRWADRQIYKNYKIFPATCLFIHDKNGQ